MAIDLEWQDERGALLARYDGPALYEKDVWRVGPESVCVRFIDPYGNTTFNVLQIDALVSELAAIGADPQLIAFVSRARDQNHTYMKFIGD